MVRNTLIIRRFSFFITLTLLLPSCVATDSARRVTRIHLPDPRAHSLPSFVSALTGSRAGTSQIITQSTLGDAAQINVKNYGAKGDGSTDDTAAIQAAINAAPNNCVIFFPSGTYLLSSSLNFPGKSTVTLVGESPDASRFYCNSLDSCVINIPGDSSVTSLSLQQLGFDGTNGKGDLAHDSSTWPGLISCQKTSGLGTFTMQQCNVQGSDLVGAIGVDLRRIFFASIENTKVIGFTQGDAVLAGQYGFTSTTLTLRKCYLQYSQVDAQVKSNVSDISFYDTVFESSGVALVTFNTKLLLSGCYFENIGFGSTSGLPEKNMGINFGLNVLTSPVDSAITDMYSQCLFDSCIFQYSNTKSSLVAWFQGIGRGSNVASNGSATFRSCVGPTATLPFFMQEERYGYAYNVYDGDYQNPIIRSESQARMVTDGIVRLTYPSPTFNRSARVEGGRLIFGLDTSSGLNSPPTDSPVGGQYEVGDAVENPSPAAGEPFGWTCTVAGAPGTWQPTGFVPNIRTITAGTASIANTDDKVEVDVNGPVKLTLPSASSMAAYSGKEITIKDISGEANQSNAISFQAGSGTSLESPYTLSTPFGTIIWYLDGTVWRVK